MNNMKLEPKNGDPFAVLPEYIGAFSLGKATPWKGKCFQKCSGTIVKLDNTGFTIGVDLAEPKSLFCSEIAMFTTPERFTFHYFLTKGHHEIRINGWNNPDEKASVLAAGAATFIFLEDIIPSLMDAYTIYKTFVRISNATETELVKFTKDVIGYEFKARKLGLLNVPESAVKSGDAFALHITTPHETEDWLLTGSHSGHVAVAMRVNGKAYVLETTDAKFLPGPIYGFHMTPFEEWKAIYARQGYEIAWLPIRKELAAIMDKNVDRVMKWFKDHTMEFITPSFGFTALDTARDNFPPPLTPETFFTLATIMDHYQHDFIHYQILQGINMRFVKYYHVPECPDMRCALERAVQLNVTIGEVMALPEIDGWLYAKGPSIVCAGLVAHVWREGGVLTMDFNAGEQDPKDIYQMGLFDPEWLDRPQACWGSTGLSKEVPYCQLAGHWAIELPEYNSVKPYPHINDHCGAQPPLYHRFPDNC